MAELISPHLLTPIFSNSQMQSCYPPLSIYSKVVRPIWPWTLVRGLYDIMVVYIIRRTDMIGKLVLAVVVAVVVTLGCYLLGGILATLKVQVAITIGNWLNTYGAVLGVLAGLWYFFAGPTPNWPRKVQ